MIRRPAARRAGRGWIARLALALAAVGAASAAARAQDAPSGGAAPGSAAGSASGSATGPAAGPGGADAGDAAGSAKILRIPTEAGAPEVNAAASPSVVRLGAHFTLFITATFAPGVEVNLREPLDLGAVFEVRRRLSEDRRAGDGRITREWQIDVTPWELGELQVAPIAVTFTAAGRAGQVATNPVPLRILGALGAVGEGDDPALLRGLAAPTGLTMRDWFWIWLATAAGAALGVALTALWLHRRRRRRTRRLVGGAIARPHRIDMTGERALERLLAVERSGVLDRDRERKAGYAEMVEVIRDYLAARYRLATRDLTSSELVDRLAAPAPADEVALIAGWLDDCDLVKYGGRRATPAEAGKVLDDARALIVATTAARPAAVQEAA